MAIRSVLRWRIDAGSDAVGRGGQPPAVELSAGIDIRQNRYRGWHPVDGAWDPGSVPFNMHQMLQVRPNGTAFGMQPACGAFPGQGPVTGFQGRRLVNSKNRNLGTLIGELQSEVFTVAGDGIDFLIGGGDFADVTCLNLYVQGDGGWTRARTATGERNLELVRRGWDVAELRGRPAYLQILDYAAVEPWGWHAAPRYPEDDWGFILVDDIRQTDGGRTPRRVDEAGDRARNFDFETLQPERFTVTAAQEAGGDGGVFEVHDGSRRCVVGRLHCTAAVTCCDTGLWRVACAWRYRGQTLSGVKLRLTSRLPITAADARYTLHPGLLYAGNPTAEACHYLGEDFPEAASTVPAGFSVEDAAWVYAGWVEPQRRAADPPASVRLQVDPESGRYEAVHQLPESAVFGRRLLLDSDERLTLEDGACYRKTLYLHASARREGGPYRPGYCDSLSAAWRQLYPVSPTNPPHTLRADYEMRLRTTLDDRGLIQEIERGGRTYRLFYVGRWVYGDAPAGDRRFLPKEYFHSVRRLLLVGHGRAGGPRGARSRPAARRRRRGAGRRGHDGLLRRARHVAAGHPVSHVSRGSRRAGRHVRHLLRPGPHRHGTAGGGVVLVSALRGTDAAARERAAAELDRGGSRLSRPHHGAVSRRRRSGAHRRDERPARRTAHSAPLLGTIALDGAADPLRGHPVRQTHRTRRHQLRLPDLGLRACRPFHRRAALPGLRRGARRAGSAGDGAVRGVRRIGDGLLQHRQAAGPRAAGRPHRPVRRHRRPALAGGGGGGGKLVRELAVPLQHLHRRPGAPAARTLGLPHRGRHHGRHQVLHQQPGVRPGRHGPPEAVAPHGRYGVVRARSRAAAPGRAELAHRRKAALAQRPLPVRGAGAGAARVQPGHAVRCRLPGRRHRGRAAGVALPRQLDHQVRCHPEHVHAGRGARRRSDPGALRRHHLPTGGNACGRLGRRARNPLAAKVAAADLLAEEWWRLFQLKMLTPWEGKTPDVVDIPVLHPWVVVSTSPTQTVFERNPYYFKVDAAGNQLPYIDRIVSTKVEGPEGASLKIIAGEVDLADELAKISSLPIYRENEANGYRAVTSGVAYNPVVHAFNFAYEDEVWRQVAGDLRFRQALNLAINRDEIIDAVYYGFASPPEWVPATYDPDEAGRLLDAVGLDKRDSDGWRLGPDGERFEINLEVTAHLPDTVPANELIAEHYRAVGLYTTLEVVEIGLFIERRNANQYQIDTLWNEATTLHAFGHAKHHLIGHIPPWSQWYNSGGEQGEEPPAWFQELYDLGLGIGPGIPWDQEIVDRYQQTFYDTIPQINVTYNPATVLIVNEELRNVFLEGVAQWVIYSSEQLYYE